MPIIIPYQDEAEWLDHKRRSVTSSEIAALFGESPYSTEYELYHRKKNDIAVIMEDNERMKWGRRLEAPIAHGLAEDYGWQVKPLKVFMNHSGCDRYGSSFDFEIMANGRKGLFELKNVDFKEYKEKWLVDGDEAEAPTHIELQLQSELEVANSNNPEPYEFGVIGALIGGNKPIIIEREWDQDMGKLLCRKVTEFWHKVDNSIEPPPIFERDGEIIKLLYSDVGGAEIDLSENERFNILINWHAAHQSAEVAAKKAKEAINAEMTIMMGTAGVARCNGQYVSRKKITKKAYSVEEVTYVETRVKRAKKEKEEKDNE